MHYRNELDGLRCLAIIGVILFHTDIPHFTGGYAGVDIFFVISGYLITSIIIGNLENNNFKMSDFYLRRMRRILPTLNLVLLITIPVAVTSLSTSNLIDYAKSLRSIGLFISNLFFYSQSGYFDQSNELKPFLHTWSLSIEEQFYVIFPITVLLCYKPNKNKLLLVLLTLFAISFTTCVITSKTNSSAAFYLIQSRAWELIAGAICAKLPRNNVCRVPKAYREVFATIGLLMVLLSFFIFDDKTLWPSYITLLPIAGSSLVIIFAFEDTVCGKILCNRILTFIGTLSYSLYLWHQPILAYTKINFSRDLTYLDKILLISLIFFLSYMSYKFIEKPFRNSKLISNKALLIITLSTSVFYFFIATLIVSNKGFPSRFESTKNQILDINTEDSIKYVISKFNSLELKNFPEKSSKKRVMIIGDSYSQDLVNSIFETKIQNMYDISVYYIPKQCGNLYGFSVNKLPIEQGWIEKCKELDPYNNHQLIALMHSADEIWLASSWQDWQIKYLPSSVNRLENNFSKRVVVFGRKDFGTYTLEQLNRIPTNKRPLFKLKMKEEHVLVSQKLRKAMKNKNFIDVSWILCHREYECNVFDKNGNLISHDGSHLTKYGAILLGNRMLPYLQERKGSLPD